MPFEGIRETLARFGDAWHSRDRAEPRARQETDLDFLPGALAVVKEPPSPAWRMLLWVLSGLLVVLLLWVTLGRLDVVAVAPGQTIPSDNSKVVQAFDQAAVQAIHVRNGDRVRSGQLLIELDPTLAAADMAASGGQLLAQTLEESRNAALLDHLAGRPVRFVPPPGTPPAVVAAQRQLLASAIAEYESSRAELVQRRAAAERDRDAARQEVAKLRETLPIEERQLAARRELADKGYYAKLRLMDYEQQYLQHRRDLGIHEASVAKAGAVIAGIDAALVSLRATLARTASTARVEAQRAGTIARSQNDRSERMRRFMQIRAPIDGNVEQLQVTTIGGVVKPAEPLLSIVPTGAPVVVEARMLNRDAGFVRPGQRARVKFEAFPFTDFGAVEGVVERVGRDAIQDEKLGPVFAVRIRLLQPTITLGGGRSQRLGAGLAATAEIRTGSRSILSYILSPIAQRADEAARER